MKEKSVDINRIYWYSLPIMMLGGPLAIILYQACHGTNYKKVLCDIGDMVAFGLVKKVSADTQVIDHSSKVGFYYN